ncbi:MAG: NUDIX domain-containing protein [Chloroflexi bacterium]|nr:NUDIX domain-containing protein [Chloroflexota bacterium]
MGAAERSAPHTAPQHVRAIALAVLLHADHLLCAQGYDVVKGEQFYRPLGGAIEFGEAAADAAVRELAEEIGRAVVVRGSLGVTENRFVFNGAPGHEVCFEFLCEFAPEAAPEHLGPIRALEGGRSFVARWLPLAEVLGGTHRVYPDGLPERLAGWLNTQ